ncbi:MAG TPA: hypothetical protein VM680_08780 [Verrucomicrobiae bacterium]|nr:hypothetical protein [Verrucomicrobiae bacterium]
MKNILILIIGLALGAGGFWLVTSRHESDHSEHKEHEEHAVEKSPHDDNVIKLDKKQQAAAGLEIALPQKGQLAGEIKGYGRVLDPSQIVSPSLDIQTARVTADASAKEFQRLKTLFSQGQNASARALEAAEATARRDEMLVGVAEAKLRATLGPALTERQDFSATIEALSKMQWALARIDVLAGAPEKLPPQIRVAPLANESASIPAELLGPAPSAETSIQGNGFLLLIKTNSLTPNTAIIGSIPVPGRDHAGFFIPAKSLLQEGPETILLVQTGDDAFRKTPVEVARITDQGAFITAGLAATNRVVISGAHQILSVTRTEAEE